MKNVGHGIGWVTCREQEANLYKARQLRKSRTFTVLTNSENLLLPEAKNYQISGRIQNFVFKETNKVVKPNVDFFFQAINYFYQHYIFYGETDYNIELLSVVFVNLKNNKKGTYIFPSLHAIGEMFTF